MTGRIAGRLRMGHNLTSCRNEQCMTEMAINGPISGLNPFGPVEMRVPCDPLASRVVRLAASGVASLGGFDVDQIDDINMAVSEVLIALIEHGDGGSIDVYLVVDDRSFTVRGRTANSAFDVDDIDLILCRTVLAGVSSHHGIEQVDDHAQIWAVVDFMSA